MPSKTQLKRWGAILGVVFVGTALFNTVANRVPAVDSARRLINSGV